MSQVTVLSVRFQTALGFIKLIQASAVFFFSSRRRHTRLVSDWSSDVCSSDLAAGREPPPSRYPRLDAGALVPIERVRLPRIPGIALPRVVHQAHRLDFGPGWPEGVITVEPPRVGAPFPALVPQVDPLGNELGGVRGVELLAPLATYTPWNLRTGYPASADELVDFLGTWVPLPRTAADAARTGDARSAIPDRYASRVSYLEAARAAARSLVAEGFLLAEDTDRVVDHAARQWDWLIGVEREPVRW